MLTEAGEEASHSCFLHETAPQVHIPINSWTVLLPHLVISLAEVFVMISGEYSKELYCLIRIKAECQCSSGRDSTVM